MKFSLLHLSDLHRDLNDEIGNDWLLDSLEKDFAQFDKQRPEILVPSLAIVSGDLVYGIKPGMPDVYGELERQCDQAQEFLSGLADRFFNGDPERVVTLPGNHDVCFEDVLKSSQRVDIPKSPDEKKRLTDELFRPNSMLRWSWGEMCFYRIVDSARYEKRLAHFAALYERLYRGNRKFSVQPSQQHDVFDFPEYSFCVVTLNSCFNNDPLHRAGSFHPTALTQACRNLRKSKRVGWVVAAAWHHNLAGGPMHDDYLDVQFIQLLVDAGVSLGFHGHQHSPECFDERYRIGPAPRKMTIVSASTLCSDARNLKPGVPRGYNVVELDTSNWIGRVHQRQMVNGMFRFPIWGPGHFVDTGVSFVEFDLCKPLDERPADLDVQLKLGSADEALRRGSWSEALTLLQEIIDVPLARPLLVKALSEIGDARQTIAGLWPPLTEAEAVIVGAAILDAGTKEDAVNFASLEIVSRSGDASVREIVTRIQERRLK